jgi:hypothetical protein
VNQQRNKETMKKLTRYQLRQISKNIDFYFNLATKKQISDGKQWYIVAHNICKDLAKKYQCDEITAAQVIAALSPRNKWQQNVKDSYKIFEAIKNNIEPEKIKVCTFHTNKFKAYNIAKNKITITDKSLKTYNFCKNIALLDNNSLTIDVWHLRACFNKQIKINSASIGRTAYEQIKKLTINKANKLGLTGYQLQAVLWITVQKYY